MEGVLLDRFLGMPPITEITLLIRRGVFSTVFFYLFISDAFSTNPTYCRSFTQLDIQHFPPLQFLPARLTLVYDWMGEEFERTQDAALKFSGKRLK